MLKKELDILKNRRVNAPRRKHGEINAQISAKEKELQKAEDMLPLYNEMEIARREHPEKFASRDPSDFSGLAKLSRGAIEATNEEVVALGEKGITVYRVSVADIVQGEVRQAGKAGVKKSVGYSSESIARIIDEVLFEKTPLEDQEKWSSLLKAFDNRPEELKNWVEKFVKRTGLTYIEAIEKLVEQVSMQESEAGELPKVIMTNANYSLIKGMDTRIEPYSNTAKNIAEYLKRGGKIIIQSGISLSQIMEWIIEPLKEGVLKDNPSLLGNILLAPYNGIRVFRFDDNGELNTTPLYDLSSRISSEQAQRLDKEIGDLWSMFTDILGVNSTSMPSISVLNNTKKVEAPVLEKRHDSSYRLIPDSEQSRKIIYYALRFGNKGELWRANYPNEDFTSMLSLTDLPETAALEIIQKLAERREIQAFFAEVYDIDDFGTPEKEKESKQKMVKVMLDISRTGRLGRHNLKEVIGRYLIYRFNEVGIANSVTVSYQKTVSDVNIYPSITRAQVLRHLLKQPYVKNEFLKRDLIKEKGAGVLLIGRFAIDILSVLPHAKVSIFDTASYTAATTDYAENAIPENVAFYNGPFGSRGFTQFLGKVLAGTTDDLLKSSSSGINLKGLSDYDAQHLLAQTLLNYSPTGIIEVNRESQAIVVYSDSLRESPALQEIIRQSKGDTRKFYLVNKEQGVSADQFLAELNIDRDIFENYIFQQNSLTADQLALVIASMLHSNGIRQGRVFASTKEDLAAWSRQGLIEALVMLLKDKRFEIISDYSQQHTEYIRTYDQALIAA